MLLLIYLLQKFNPAHTISIAQIQFGNN